MKIPGHVLACALALLAAGQAHAQPAARRIPSPAGMQAPLWAVAAPSAAQSLWVSDQRSLYRSIDEGRRWEKIWQTDEQDGPIAQLLPTRRRLLVLSSHALYGIGSTEPNGRRNATAPLFAAQHSGRDPLLSIAADADDPDILVVGSRGCVWMSLSAGLGWQRIPLGGRRERFEDILLDATRERAIWVASARNVYKCGPAFEGARRVFSVPRSDEQEEVEPTRPLRLASSEGLGRHWIGTAHGIWESQDAGGNFMKLTCDLMRDPAIVDLLFAPQIGLLAATPRGAFRLAPADHRFAALPGSLAVLAVHLLSARLADVPGVYALTPEGLYAWSLEPDGPREITMNAGPRSLVLDEIFRREPRVQDLHARAVAAAQISLSQLARWRRRSRARTLLPEISLGLDKAVASNVDLDRGGSASPDIFIEGPQDRDRSIGVKLTWDLRDLIWSSEERNIATLAKWFVEYREDLISEITRLYFERRKVLIELANPWLSPDEESERWLAVDELTARLDAFTGNYFSRQVAELHDLYEKLSSQEPLP